MSTGSESTRRKDTTSEDQVKTGKRIIVMPGALMLMIVTMKFMAPINDEVPRMSSDTT